MPTQYLDLTKDNTNSVFWRLYSAALGYNQRLFYLAFTNL
jgi:hypothetical protein